MKRFDIYLNRFQEGDNRKRNETMSKEKVTIFFIKNPKQLNKCTAG